MVSSVLHTRRRRNHRREIEKLQRCCALTEAVLEPCGETARPKERRWRGESAFRAEDSTGSGFLFFSSPVILHGSGAWFRSDTSFIIDPLPCATVSGGELRRVVNRGLFLGSRGQRASSFTMTEWSTGVVGLVGNVWRSSESQHQSDFQSGLHDQILAMNRGNDRQWSEAESETRLGVGTVGQGLNVYL
ncbi:hypothetical protein Bca4012_063923 [Brassica carinata]